MKRVRVGQIYRFDPVPIDVLDSQPHILKGDIVEVIEMSGCPKTGTMGMCYIARTNNIGKKHFALVMCASLQPFRG